jgi:hypothetical protein
MRKAVEWIIYPAQEDRDTIVIQSDHRIAAIDPKTCRARLSAHKTSGAYFAHLNSFMGATEIDVPREIVEQLVAEQPQKGDVLMSGGGFKIIAG